MDTRVDSPPATVLVVEDDPQIAAHVARTLRANQLRVEVAANVAEARGALAEDDWDLVLLDVDLPDGTGLALQELLTDHPAQPGVVIVSGLNGDLLRRAFEFGARDFIRKPFRQSELIARVRAALREREHERQLTREREEADERARVAAALAQLEERERIAMELHDGTVQTLYGLGARLAALELAGAFQPTPEPDLQAIRRQINAAIEQLRSYVADLPRAIDLRRALETVVDELAVPGTQVELRYADAFGELAQRIGARSASHLVQIAHEAVSNAARHGQAGRIWVRAGQSRGRLLLEVVDDGRGFDPALVSAGAGLANMRERAAALGGRLDVRRRAGGGTRVRLEVPVP